MIRVIGGIYKGKKLRRVGSDRVRPLPNKLKETLFNIIQGRLPDALFLDGFAGTGSAGIEALSRGARTAVFIEEFPAAAKVIQDNIAKCGAEENARIVRKEFNRAIIQLAKEGARFDVIFLDPPYRLLDERNPLKVIAKRDVLKEGGMIILRHFSKTIFDAKYYEVKRRMEIGDDVLLFYSG